MCYHSNCLLAICYFKKIIISQTSNTKLQPETGKGYIFADHGADEVANWSAGAQDDKGAPQRWIHDHTQLIPGKFTTNCCT